MADLRTLLYVMVGGALGSGGRYLLGQWAQRLTLAVGTPWLTTLGINVVGSFALGWFLRSSATADWSTSARALVAIGLCGGFTTFSTFAYETVTLLEYGQQGRAALYILLSLALSIGAVAAGAAAGR